MLQVKKIIEFSGHNGAIYALEQSEEQPCFYSGSSDNIVAKWNSNTLLPEKFAAKLPGITYSLCYIKEKNVLLAGTSEGKIHAIDLSEKKEMKIILNHNQPVFDIKYDSTKKLIISAGGDGILSIISSDNFNTLKLLKLCNEKIRAIDICESEAAIACGDGVIRIIDLKQHTIKYEYPAHSGSVYSIKYSPGDNQIISGGKDAHLKIWKKINEKWENEKSIPAHNYAIYSLVFSPDGKYLASASRDKTIKIWNASTFDILARINKENFNGHSNSVNKLFWSPQDNRLVSCSDDRKIMVWEVN